MQQRALCVCSGIVGLLPAVALSWGSEVDSETPRGILRPDAGKPARLTLLPQDRGDESPACLDGSPYGVYFVPSARNSTRWTIYLQGGGWCYDEALCYARSKTFRGSSAQFPRTTNCSCLTPAEDGTIDDDCNCLYMPYGDGASFAGFRPQPWPVPGKPGTQLYFRGIKNFDAALDFAFANGLTEATEVVLTGESAGGLSTFLHADRMGQRLAEQAPNCARFRAAPVVGYFLDHADYRRDAKNYTALMKNVYRMQNLTFGTDGGLMARCQEAFPDSPNYCFMSPHMQGFVETPFFVFNSKYDLWQLDYVLKTSFATKAGQKAVLQFGEDFLQQFEPVQSEPENGAMITSCICHSCPWDDLELDGKRSFEHFADWYLGRTRGADAVHIDSRTPNGDGSLTYKACKRFPPAGNTSATGDATGMVWV